jgi:hypothetical protein
MLEKLHYIAGWALAVALLALSGLIVAMTIQVLVGGGL